MTNLAHACVAPDKKPEDKAKMKGIYQRATSLKFVLYLNFMMDFLQPLKIASLMFQDDDVFLPVLSRKLQGITDKILSLKGGYGFYKTSFCHQYCAAELS
jgi:hypothetical protein